MNCWYSKNENTCSNITLYHYIELDSETLNGELRFSWNKLAFINTHSGPELSSDEKKFPQETANGISN